LVVDKELIVDKVVLINKDPYSLCCGSTDMGLSHSIRQGALNVTSVTSIDGTNGYIDGHYQQTGRYDVMCDAYSMGVTVLVTLSLSFLSKNLKKKIHFFSLRVIFFGQKKY
jgi:hypothetical protein